MKNMEKRFEFKKVGKDKCAFIMHSDDIERTEVVSEEFAKNHYKNLLEQRNEVIENINKINKDVELNRVEQSDELERFIKNSIDAGKYKKFTDSLQNLKATKEMLDNINNSIEAIQKVMPEVKRMKK